MAVVFRPQLASWVLITRAPVASVVHHPDVAAAVGAPASSVVQLPEVAIAEYPDLQLSYVERGPDRYSLSVTQRGAPTPNRPLVAVAKAAFRHVLAQQAAVAIGLNFVRQGTVTESSAGSRLLRLLAPNATQLPGKRLTGAGIKLFYEDDPWHVSVTLEPAVDDGAQLVATVNYHLDTPSFDNVDADLDRLLDQTGHWYAAFATVLNTLLPEDVHAAVF